MRTRLSMRIAAAAAFALLLGLPALSQDRGGVLGVQGPSAASAGPAWDRDHDGLRDLLRCLRILDLTDAQKAAIHQFIEAERPTLQALHDTLKADRETLHTDASATPPDPCKVGSDFLIVRADRLAIVAEIGKIKDFIESQLTDVQKALFEGCIKGTTAAPTAG